MAEPFSLLTEPWLPVRRRSGRIDHLRPAEIVDGLADEPVLGFAWGRPDLDAASREFLIGLLATACPPLDGKTWEDRWHHPPDVATLDAAFAAFADAFLLDGDGPRFLQDQGELEKEDLPISELLLDAPGNGHFAKYEDAQAIARTTAAIALSTAQTFSPPGGRGHQTSVRGAGPLTTLLIPGAADGSPVPLWHMLWVNVPGTSSKFRNEPATPCSKVFPWLGPTRVSDKGSIVTPEHVHIAQQFWGMPRRIRLEFEPNAANVGCAVTGRIEPVVVRVFRRKSYGPAYVGWRHPLTPYVARKEPREKKKGNRKKPHSPWAAVTPRAGGVGYRDWVGLVQSRSNATEPAACIVDAEARLRHLSETFGRAEPRMLASGYSVAKAKAVAFVEAEMPIYLLSLEQQEVLDSLAQALVEGSQRAADFLISWIRAALLPKQTRIKEQASFFLTLRERFWTDTDRAFFEQLATSAGELERNPEDVLIRRRASEAWIGKLRLAALAIFDDACPFEQEANMKRIVTSRRELAYSLRGLGKDGKWLYDTLGLAPAEPATKPRRRKKTAR